MPPKYEFCESSEVLKSGKYTFDGEKFTAYDLPREDPKRLKEILFPERNWFISQLHHYGILFKSKDTLLVLRELLEEAVKGGKCKSVPEDIQTVENHMRMAYYATKTNANTTASSTTAKSNKAKPEPKKTTPAATKPAVVKPTRPQVLRELDLKILQPKSQKVEKASSIGKAQGSHRSKLASRKAITAQDIQWPKRGFKTFTPQGDIYLDAVGEYEIDAPAIISKLNGEQAKLSLNIFMPRDGNHPIGIFDFAVSDGVIIFTNDRSIIGTSSALQRSMEEMEWEPSHQTKKKLYFQWRGASIQGGTRNTHYFEEVQVGFLEFDDEGCSSFTGYGTLPGMDGCKFRGYKHYDKPDCRKDWVDLWQDEYSDVALERYGNRQT